MPAAASVILPDATELAARVRPDGSWADLADLDPFASDPTVIPEHLQRTLVLARADRGADGAVRDALRRAFDFWLAHDFQAADWRQNQLVVPHVVGSVALFADTGLSPGARGKVTEILARSRWQHWVTPDGWIDWTGMPLLRIAQNVILRGCVCDTPAQFEEAFARVFKAIRVVADGEEGIQPDMIYHAAQPQPSDSYNGMVYAAECARFAVLAHGTQWQAPTESMRLLTDFLLDGQQWLMRNGVIDSNFPVQKSHQASETLGELAVVVERLAQLGNTPRQAELASLARRLAGRGETLTGHRHFWRSGFSVHQRPAYYTSVCLPWTSPPSLDETAADASRQHRVPAGMTCVMRSGNEYEGIATVTPSDGLPGTTFFRAAPSSLVEDLSPSDPSLAGGVSEGDYGVAAMRTARPGLTATKAWFYFDDSFVCLGAGINASGSNQPVFTSVNHCRLNGPVIAVADLAKGRTLSPGAEHALPMVRRIVHDGVTYHFTRPSRVVAQVGLPQSAGLEASTAFPEPFALRVNHGLNPQEEMYGYIVLPLGDDPAAKAKTEEEVTQIEVIANTPAVQAVRHRGLKLLGVAFWQAGMVTLPGGGRAAANQPCVLLCRETASAGKRLSIANLRHEATTVHIEYAGRCLCFELPGGADARRGISRSL